MILQTSFLLLARSVGIVTACVAGILFVCPFASFTAPASDTALQFHGALLAAEDATSERLRNLKSAGVTAIAIPIHNDKASRGSEKRASKRIQENGLSLCFWIEVARCPELAKAHPGWMASLQGHQEWRRLFGSMPAPGDGEVVKNYPWVPILNKEPFEGQLSRVKELLRDRPQPKMIFLNDLQGAPSACGCGHHLCRWTSDYGKLRTTTPLGAGAPADFATAVGKLTPLCEVVPVWTTECEQHDGAKDGLCAGVRCFQGKCWEVWTEQLTPMAARFQTIGALLPYKAFQRDLPVYGAEAGWLAHAVRSFQTMPARYKAPPVPASRLLAVLQGWEVTEREIAVQFGAARAAGVQRILVSHHKIEQDWTPRITKVR